MNEVLDIIIFGVTGFTGKHTAAHLYKLNKNNKLTLSWGIAGRNDDKLLKVLEDLKESTGDKELLKIPRIYADINNEKSLEEMASKAKIIVNCCGPYRYFGEPVIKACLKTGTHHVDVSGETQYIEKLALDYNDKAREKNIYFVSSCGLDSIPSDLGVIFLSKMFEGVINSVEIYYSFGFKNASLTNGPLVNYGTWSSAVNVIANMGEVKKIRQKLYPTEIPEMRPKISKKLLPSKVSNGSKWSVLFPSSDIDVMNATQRYMYENKNKRPVQIETYLVLKRFWYVLFLGIFATIVFLLAQFKFGQKLLLDYPEFFSAGIFSKKEPSEEKIKNCWFKLTLHAKGWDEALANPNDQYTTPPNKEMVAEVRGQNPGYGATCICLVLSAITILTEKDKLPKEGGVYTPGSIFADTSLVDQLNKNDVTFKIVQNNKL